MTQKQKGFIGLGVMIALAGAVVLGSTPLYEAIDKMASDSVSYTPGSYTGSADGYGGKIIAAVTVSESGIDSVALTGDDETPEFGGAALEVLEGKFTEAQSSQVDAISGSTITSQGAMAAVAEALDQASGKIDVIPAPETQAETMAVTEAATTEAATTEAAGGTGTFKPGTYTGSAQGYGGEVTATVVVTDQGIESVELVGSDETEELGGVALEELSKEMVEAQTSSVDAISGSTITSDAAIEAAGQALEQAASGDVAAAAPAASYTPGTYEGTAQGFGGDVNATVVIGESGIESVKLVGSDETEDLGGVALEKLQDKFIEAQSSQVDAISGSTVTCDAAVAAVQQALDQAK